MLQAWNQILGQQNAVESLRKAYLAERLPHGLIFAGPAGVGKRSTSDVLSRLFLCEHPKADEACGRCESCRVFAAGNHPDWHLIFKELIRYHDKTGKSKGVDLSINVIRPELIEPASRKAVMGRGKVFVVEQAELMNAAAQNALLKTLEEPAGRTLIVLLSEQADALLPTVRSRCRIIHFSPLDLKLVEQELAKRNIPPEQAAEAAKLSGGSLGRAVKWLDEGVVEKAAQLRRQLSALLQGGGLEDLAGWLRQAADAYAEKQLDRDELASKEQATREGLGVYLQIASEFFRQSLEESGHEHRLEAICSMIDAIAEAERYLDANVNVAIALQGLTMSLEAAGSSA